MVPHTGARLHVPQGDAIFDSVKYMYPLGSEGKVESTLVTEPECADAIARADAPLLQLFNSCENIVVTTVVPAVLKAPVTTILSCFKVKRHSCEPTPHNFAVLSNEQVMAKFVSGENWTSVIASSCPRNTSSSLPSWLHNSAISPLATSI